MKAEEKERYKKIDRLLVKKCYTSLGLLADSLEKVFEELISLLKILENTGPADRGKNKSPALIAYLCGFPESGHVRKTKLRLTIN